METKRGVSVFVCKKKKKNLKEGKEGCIFNHLDTVWHYILEVFFEKNLIFFLFFSILN
jgi:hypothetical protein